MKVFYLESLELYGSTLKTVRILIIRGHPAFLQEYRGYARGRG